MPDFEKNQFRSILKLVYGSFWQENYLGLNEDILDCLR